MTCEHCKEPMTGPVTSESWDGERWVPLCALPKLCEQEWSNERKRLTGWRGRVSPRVTSKAK